MENNSREFVAFSRKLLDLLLDVRELLDNGDVEGAGKKIDRLIKNTERDIEA